MRDSDVKRIDTVIKTAATHTLITGVANKRLRILSLFVRSLSSIANTIYFKEEDGSATCFGTNSVDVETLDQVGISGKSGWLPPPNPDGWFETTTVGKGFQAVLSVAQPVAIVGTYVEIRD